MYMHVASNRNYHTHNVHIKFWQLMSSSSSSQGRMEEKPAQFQEEVRLVPEEVVTTVLKKARYDNSYVSYS